MSEGPFDIIDGDRHSQVEAHLRAGRALVFPDALETALGWELKPQGFCRDDVCVPVREGSGVVSDQGIDLAAFAGLIGRPIALDLDERAAYVGAAARDRAAALSAMEAPDFRLPDLDGRMHTLSEHRGKKVFLVAWASW